MNSTLLKTNSLYLLAVSITAGIAIFFAGLLMPTTASAHHHEPVPTTQPISTVITNNPPSTITYGSEYFTLSGSPTGVYEYRISQEGDEVAKGRCYSTLTGPFKLRMGVQTARIIFRAVNHSGELIGSSASHDWTVGEDSRTERCKAEAADAAFAEYMDTMARCEEFHSHEYCEPIVDKYAKEYHAWRYCICMATTMVPTSCGDKPINPYPESYGEPPETT